jgi:hypothetical protein
MSVDIDRHPVGGNGNAHKEVDIADDIAAVEPKLGQNLGEIGEAAVRATDAIAQEIVGRFLSDGRLPLSAVADGENPDHLRCAK